VGFERKCLTPCIIHESFGPWQGWVMGGQALITQNFPKYRV